MRKKQTIKPKDKWAWLCWECLLDVPEWEYLCSKHIELGKDAFIGIGPKGKFVYTPTGAGKWTCKYIARS